MADFVAVLKKTIDGLGETTPEMRARVYEKARATISAKLAALNPAPAQAVIDRQKASLEDAISTVEKGYLSALEAVDEDFETIVAQLTEPAKAEPAPPPAVTPAPKPHAAEPPAPKAPATEKDAVSDPAAGPAAKPAPVPAPEITRPAPPVASTLPLAGSKPVANDSIAPETRRPARSSARPRSRSGGLIAVALIALVFLGAAGYAVWLNRDEVAQLVGFDPFGSAGSSQAPAAANDAPAQPASQTPAKPAEPAAAPASEPAAVQKFTQKLNPDGSETDTGPSGGTAETVGEGTSVATLTVPPEGAAAPAQPAASLAQETPAAVAVGQKAIFYEERTSAADGSAQMGNTVWSLVQESPGGDLPPEPAIRAVARIPGKDVQLQMTIRRNADRTLPASHIIELIFLTPENFEGGVIDNLLRMTFKETEQATGNPVIGSPAKIGDGFFLIALSDGQQEEEANMQLFRRMEWIDIPIIYRSGRRALMTLERGIPGDKVFEEALKGWAARSG